VDKLTIYYYYMNKEYIICDNREESSFKDITFSGFKRKDVYNSLYESMDKGKIEDACYWLTELFISGKIFDLFEKLMIYNSKIIHINNPNLPYFLFRKYRTFKKSINHISDKGQYIHLRNTQSIRNMLFDIVSTLSTTTKTNKYDNYPKIKKDVDFQIYEIQNKLNATMNILPSTIIRFTDPEELKIIMNEFYFNLKNKNGGYDKCSYWLSWLIGWEKINKKKNIRYEIEQRDIKGVKSKYCKDCIWLIWETIFHELQERDDNIKKQIKSLYLLFIEDYTCGKKLSRLPYVYHSIGYLTLPVKWEQKIRNDYNIFIQCQSNINIMFKSKKNKEVKDYQKKVDPKKSKVDEINSAKMDYLLIKDEKNI